MKLLVTAEAFGYGPIITCLNIAEKLIEKLDIEMYFLGSGIALEQAIRSNIFKSYVECDTFDKKSLLKNSEIFDAFEYVLSVENIEGAVYAVSKNKKVFFVDNLFWMWNEVRYELGQVEKYYIMQTFDVETNINKFANKIKNMEIIGPLRNLEFFEKVEKEKKLLINFGGAESFLIDDGIIEKYYKCLLENILRNIENVDIDEIVVCGGSKLISKLSTEEYPYNIIFKSFKKDEYLKHLYESKYIIMSSGLGNFFESLCIGQEIIIIPPINYSQFWQSNEYKKLNLGYSIINWNDFEWYYPVIKGEEEEEGVKQVLNNVKKYILEYNNYNQIDKLVNMYLKKEGKNYSCKRKKYYYAQKRCGINCIVDDILEVSK